MLEHLLEMAEDPVQVSQVEGVVKDQCLLRHWRVADNVNVGDPRVWLTRRPVNVFSHGCCFQAK